MLGNSSVLVPRRTGLPSPPGQRLGYYCILTMTGMVSNPVRPYGVHVLDMDLWTHSCHPQHADEWPTELHEQNGMTEPSTSGLQVRSMACGPGAGEHPKARVMDKAASKHMRAMQQHRQQLSVMQPAAASWPKRACNACAAGTRCPHQAPSTERRSKVR